MLIIRHTTNCSLRSLIHVSRTRRCFSRDYASSDDEKKYASKKSQKAGGFSVVETSESAASRLNRLLASMETDDNTLTKHPSLPSVVDRVVGARPGDGVRTHKDAATRQFNTKYVLEAAKRVASLLGNGSDAAKKQTESELLAKLLSSQDGVTNGPSGRADGKVKPFKKISTKNSQDADLSLSELIVAMKIDRRQQTKEQTRGDFVRRTLSHRQQGDGSSQKYQSQSTSRVSRTAEIYTGTVNLFGGEALSVFKQSQQKSSEKCIDLLSTWRNLDQVEMKMLITHPPSNYFEKLALWTAQGKLWRFPIDNEQDWDEESDVDFMEHIFLEQHLDNWCPLRGPVRHFMELVCVGLSKNPYLTAQDKREHIFWYRDYFGKKKNIITELIQKDDTTGWTDKQLVA